MFELRSTTRTCGFRLSATDVVVIGLLFVVAVVFKNLENPLWWLTLIAGGHFFLFCNVFRVRRPFELFWASSFLINAAGWLWFGNLNWGRVLAIQLPITIGVVVAEIRSSSYHGIFASKNKCEWSDQAGGESDE